MGFCDTGGNVMLIWQYGSEVGPFMQGMHFTFALGATLGPLLLRLVAHISGGGSGHYTGTIPDNGSAAAEGEAGGIVAGQGSYDAAFYIIAFYNALLGGLLLMKKSPKPRQQVDSASSSSKDTTSSVAVADASSEHAAAGILTDGSVQHATIDSQAIVAPADVEVAASAAQNGHVTTATRRASGHGAGLIASPADAVDEWAAGGSSHASAAVSAESGEAAGGADAAAPPAPASTHGGDMAVPPHLRSEVWKVVLIVAALLFLYVGCETGFGGFVTSYAVVHLHASEADGQLLAGVYWAAIMVGRFSSIFVAMKFPPAKYLGASMIASCGAAVFLMIFAENSIVALWIGSVLYGLGLACQFPTAIALAESYFPVQGKHATAFVVGAAIGEMLLPFIISTLFGGDVNAQTGAATDAAASSGPGPYIMILVVGITTILNMGFYFLLVKQGKALHEKIKDASSGNSNKEGVKA